MTAFGERPFVDLPLDASLYPLPVVYRACYRLTDRFYFWLQRSADGLLIRIWAKGEGSWQAEEAAGELCNALLDEALRIQIATETEAMRSTLMTVALAEALQRPCT